MINLCVLLSIVSCCKVYWWLFEYWILFYECNMNVQLLMEIEIKYLLQYMYNGIDDLISIKFNVYY